MNRFLNAILAALLSLSASQVLAEPPDLLISASDSEQAVGQASNEYFLKKETYFAKQYRLVKVDTDLLLNAERIKISLFDDLVVILQVSSVDVHPEGLDISWKGRFIEPSISIEDLLATGVSREDAELVHPHLNSLSISAAQVSFDERRRLKYPYYFPRFERFRLSTQKFSLDEESGVYDVGFLIQGAGLPKVYELRPLASDPQLHVLIEWDPDKIFATPIERPDPNAVAGYAESPENSAKRQRYQEFLDSLGSDPRPPDFDRE